MHRKSKAKNTKKKKKTNMFHFAGITLLCAFSTFLLLFVVTETSMTGLTTADSSSVMNLSASFMGVFLILVAGFVIWKLKS